MQITVLMKLHCILINLVPRFSHAQCHIDEPALHSKWYCFHIACVILLQVCIQRGFQPPEQDHFQLFPLPMDSVSCPCCSWAGLLYHRIPCGAEVILL